MLKLADINDLDIVKDFIHKFHQESPYQEIPINDEHMDANLKAILLSDRNVNVIILAYTEEGEAKGVIIGQAAPFLLTGQKIASELSWWVEPEFRRTPMGKDLFEAYIYWAKQVGCEFVQSVALHDERLPLMERLYRKQNFTPCETSYLRKL